MLFVYGCQNDFTYSITAKTRLEKPTLKAKKGNNIIFLKISSETKRKFP